MKKLLICLLCLIPMFANADVVYQDQQSALPKNMDTFAPKHRFYIGAMYDFSIWHDYVGDADIVHGKNTSGLEAIAGFRAYDIFRIETNYMNTRAKWDEFAIKTDTLFLNAIIDARIDSLYRPIYKQKLVPYVGIGTGLTWYHSDDVKIKNDTNISVAAMAGLGIELGENFAIDLGYRYVYMFKPGIEQMSGLDPSAHQLRIGARVNF